MELAATSLFEVQECNGPNEMEHWIWSCRMSQRFGLSCCVLELEEELNGLKKQRLGWRWFLDWIASLFDGLSKKNIEP